MLHDAFAKSSRDENQMQTPVQIEFHNVTETAKAHADIEQHVAELEKRFGHITACRVRLEGPGERHQTGGLYHVHIRLALPDGREVNIGRTPPADERYADGAFAIDNAFKRARRQLQDQVRRLAGQVKHHEGMPTGRVVRLDPGGEFGFIETGDGQEIYFHRNSVLDGMAKLSVGAAVTFAEERGERGPQASTVKLLGRHRLRA
jgi:cold shock CspA family protein/ribosome-associated translation inhibitor RaiA